MKKKKIYITEMGIKRNSGELSRRQGATRKGPFEGEQRKRCFCLGGGRRREWRTMAGEYLVQWDSKKAE